MPPNVEAAWDDNDEDTQARIIAYSQIREREDEEVLLSTLGTKGVI